MRFTIMRGVAIFTVLALTACGRGMVPVQTPASGFSFSGAAVQNAADPCETLSKEKLWYFHGSCLAEKVNGADGTAFQLTSYKGITELLELTPVSGSVPANTSFVTGDGTGSSDITGTYKGEKFPLYDSKGAPCISPTSSATKCAGKAIVYDLLFNDSKNEVTFMGSPSVLLTAPTPLKHQKTCTLNQLVQSGGKWAYQVTPVTGKIKNGKVTLPVYPFSVQFVAHSFKVLAISCT
jgi:hypothetical protein